MSSTIRYLYLRDEKKFPVALLAYLLDESSEQATYGLATFDPTLTVLQSNSPHPKSPDAKFGLPKVKKQRVEFDRKFLREIAVGRLITQKKTIDLPKKDCQDMHDIVWVIVSNLLNDKDVPKRTRKAINNWLLEARKYDLEKAVNEMVERELTAERTEDYPEEDSFDLLRKEKSAG